MTAVRVTRQNVCGIHGHDVRWRRIHGPVLRGARRKAILVCLDCGRGWTGFGEEEIK